MRPGTHIKFACAALVLWLAFWVGGLPEYYQQYSFGAMLAFCLALVPAIVLVAWKVIGSVAADRRTRLGFWLSFYFTVPFFLLDLAYCGLYLRHGWHFLIAYWYLTVFYVLLWLLIVPIARMRSVPPGLIRSYGQCLRSKARRKSLAPPKHLPRGTGTSPSSTYSSGC